MLEYTDKKVLITGAGGFIGSHLTEKLIDLGADVTAYLWQNEKEKNNLPADLAQKKPGKLNIHFGDLKEDNELVDIMQGIDIVFHLAGINSAPYSLSHPRQALVSDLTAAINLLAAAREAKVKRFVFTSSAAVYGPPFDKSIAEDHGTFPASPYAAGKLAAENIVLSFYHAYGLPAVILRLFNTYGPRQAQNAVIPNIIMQALRGKEIKLGRTDATRDFNYVLNAAAGFAAAGITDNTAGEIFNIASGVEHSLEELIALVEDLVNKKLKVSIEDTRKRPARGDADRLYAAIGKARRMLHYQPVISFHEGLKLTVDYYTNFTLNRYQQD